MKSVMSVYVTSHSRRSCAIDDDWLVLVVLTLKRDREITTANKRTPTVLNYYLMNF